MVMYSPAKSYCAILRLKQEFIFSSDKNIILTGKNMVLNNQQHDSNQEYFSYFVEQNVILLSGITFLKREFNS